MALSGGIDSRFAEWEKFLGWIIVSVIPLLPVVFFYAIDRLRFISRVMFVFVGVLVVHVELLLMSGVFGLISASSMGLVGVSEDVNRDYLVDSRQYPRDVLNPKCWTIDGRGEHHYVLKAFSLYHFGSINLLCPVSLSGTDIRKIGQYTDACIPFRDDAIRKLGVVGKEDVDKMTTNEAWDACLGAVVNPTSRTANSSN